MVAIPDDIFSYPPKYQNVFAPGQPLRISVGKLIALPGPPIGLGVLAGHF